MTNQVTPLGTYGTAVLQWVTLALDSAALDAFGLACCVADGFGCEATFVDHNRVAIGAYALGNPGAGIELCGNGIGHGWNAAAHGRFANIGGDADDRPFALLAGHYVVGHVTAAPY